MKILFIHEVNYRAKVIFEMHEVPELLAERGHDIFFIDFPEQNGITPLKFRTTAEQISGRVRSLQTIHLYSLPRFLPYPFDRIWTAALGWISIKKIFEKIQPDIVVLYAVPTTGWQSLIIANKFKTPVVYRAIDMSHKIRETKFSFLIKKAERFVINRCDFIIANSDPMKKYIENLATGPIHVDTLYAGVQHYEAPSRPKGIIAAWNNEIPTIVFMGTLFRFCGLEWFLQEMHEVVRKGFFFRLLIIGDGEIRSKLEQQVRVLQLSDYVTFTGLVSFEELYEKMIDSTAAIIPFDEIELTHVALPAKVPQYLVCGLPTIATRLEGLQSLLPEGKGVVYCQPGKEFMNAVVDLLSKPEKRNQMVHDGQEQLTKKTDWNQNINELENLLIRLTT